MNPHASDRGRILIVDDDQKVRDLLVELLEQEGYEVAYAPDGGVGFELATSFEPDLVISDVVMPVVDGFTLCRNLKHNPLTASIPVLLISGIRNTADDSIEGLTAGADDYLDLPFRNEELFVKVARLVERHRVERHYRDIVERAADIIYARDMEGYLASINAAGARFFGRSASELVGTHLSQLIGAESAASDIAETKRAEAGVHLRSVYCLKDATGRSRYLEGVITVERDRSGKASGVRGVVRDITEQRLAEDALKETERRLRTVVSSASLILFAIDKDGVITLSEGEGLKVLNLKPGEVVGQSVFELYREMPDVLDDVKRALAGETFSSAVAVGDLFFDTRFSPLFDEHNQIAGVIGVATDVTENRKAEKSIRESEERYRELFENATDIIYTHDLAGNFTSLNRSGERLTGYAREEACRMNVADVIAPEYLNLARRMTAQKAAGNAPTEYELEIVSKDGRRVRLEVSTQLIVREGNPVGVQGIGRDLTERKRSEEELRETRAFFHSFMDNSPAVAFMKDAEGRYVYVNKPFERNFGQTLAFLEGRTSFDWLPKETARATHEHDLQVLATGTPQEIMETVPTQDGDPHHWLVFKFPMPDTSGQRFVAGVGVDITERRRAEEALAQQAQREAMTHRISQAIRCSLDSAEIFRTAVRELGSYLNVDRCSLFMRNDRAMCATNVAEYHADGVMPAAADFPLSDLTALIDALDEKGILAFNDAAHDRQIADVYERILAKAHVRSIMYVAIRVGDEVTAAFALSTTKELRNWSQADIDLAKAVADQTGIAIRQADLYQKSEATSTREALVNRLTMAIRASLSLSEVLSTSTRELGRALSASRVLLHLYDPEHPISPVEHEYVAAGIPSISGHTVSYDDPVGQYLLKAQKPIIIEDGLNYYEGSPEFSAYVRSYSENVTLRSQIDYPLVVKGLFRGVLCIQQTDRVRRWSEDELALVEAVAERLTVGIAQAELFGMVARGKQEWETTFDAMSDGIFIFDSSGVLKRVNRAGAALEAVHPRALLGKKCCEILRTSSEDQTCIVERAIAENRGVTIEITPERLNRPLLVSVEPIVDSANKPVAVVSTARDLSELRNVQAVAREHQSLLTNILESARESIYAVDTEGRFKWVNTATVAGLGYRRDEFIGRHLLEMVYEGDRQLVSNKVAAALQGQPQTYEMRYFASDGRLRYARVDNSPLVVEGKTTGVLGIARDITEQKEERERAARADKLRALGQLASGVAHDFNNSLAAILGRAQLLRRQTRDDALVRNLDIIQTAAEDAAATVRRIQTFARKSQVKEFEMLDVRSLLNDAIEITRTRWENEARLRGLDYKVMLNADSGLFTYGSASELREVFVNLIVNAVDAMPRGGRLSLSCVRVNGRLQLRFADSGAGMPDDVQQKIFEPFFSTKGAHGTGLGLSVSYSIIERHEGAISVSSEPGRGTVFTIDLPAVEAGTSSADEPVNAEATASISILVIDDEPPVRETLADMLEALHHRVVLAEGGQAALKKIALENFDLVFSDLAMPEMDGWETARAIRKRQPDAKIVLVTGYGPGTLPPDGEDDLVDAIIGKPFDFAQVTQTIKQVIGNRTVLENVGA
ncbi:MAG TPA: PAS domain S-box protein [Pyrinomonadaceae bacterium]|nr:PAS domain S-box protein [Pyrinomonadaceae bacterium]